MNSRTNISDPAEFLVAVIAVFISGYYPMELFLTKLKPSGVFAPDLVFVIFVRTYDPVSGILRRKPVGSRRVLCTLQMKRQRIVVAMVFRFAKADLRPAR
ncbi:hypothetical protein F5Y16DRAFT_395314 [Xylariaceae sp. FL0255]|nr:hypothetical protein F5Y16DRAFT_395314 [Xylariaceae sp. FL0255]